MRKYLPTLRKLLHHASNLLDEHGRGRFLAVDALILLRRLSRLAQKYAAIWTHARVYYANVVADGGDLMVIGGSERKSQDHISEVVDDGM